MYPGHSSRWDHARAWHVQKSLERDVMVIACVKQPVRTKLVHSYQLLSDCVCGGIDTLPEMTFEDFNMCARFTSSVNFRIYVNVLCNAFHGCMTVKDFIFP